MKYHLYALLAIVFWSTIELASKLLGTQTSPYTITAWRFLIGGLVLLPFALAGWKKRTTKPGILDLLLMVSQGVLVVCISMLLLQLSIYYGKASVSGVLVSSNPLFVSIFALLLLREKLGLFQILGLVMGLIGISLLILGEADLQKTTYVNLPLSMGLALLAAVTFGLYTALTKRSILRHGNLLTNSVAFLSGAAILFLYNLLSNKPMLFDITGQNLAIMLYLGAVVSGIAYLWFFESVKHLGANQASLYFFLKPVIASGLAVVVLQEQLTGLQIMAIAVIIAGLTLSKLHRKN